MSTETFEKATFETNKPNLETDFGQWHTEMYRSVYDLYQQDEEQVSVTGEQDNGKEGSNDNRRPKRLGFIGAFI